MDALNRRGLIFILVLAVAAGSAASFLSAQSGEASQTAPYHSFDKSESAARSWNNHPKQPIAPVAAHATAKASSLTGIKILPSSMSLAIPRLNQRVVVEGIYADGHEADLTDEAKIKSSDPAIAAVDKDGFAHPEGNGHATISASFKTFHASAPLVVTNFTTPFVWSFRNHVLPVMTKMGCNSGPCHGAAAGKNGFKLTLRGYDPLTDYYTLTHQAIGRRTDRMEPAKSLILLKPTLTIAHGGGQRFPVGSPEYKVISGWIAAGMPPPKTSDPQITGLTVLPGEASLVPGAKQQMVVLAKFSDGHTEDVTRWAKYSSGDEGVATVDPQGLVTMHGYGEAPVTVWYLSHVTFARMRIPYPYDIQEAVYRDAPRHNYIDNYILTHLKALHIPPSRPATDAEFIRRAYLDAAGIVPTPKEVEAFLKDRSPNKRNHLIEALMKRPEFVDYWAYKWSDMLLVSSNKLSYAEMWSYYDWIRQNVAENTPWNKFVDEIVTASGNTLQNGAANYWVIHRDPIEISENMTEAFLGMNITCAHCHNHPLAKWTQKDYFGMANLFARVRLKMGAPGTSRPGVGPIFKDVTVYSGARGQYTDERFSHPLPPKPLGAKALPMDTTQNLRQYFASWLTSSKNPYFARAIVNRVWRNLMGEGLVEPVDDMRATNPPTNEALLNALVKDFVAHNFDVDYLIRTIMESATYQTASAPTKENIVDQKYYSHYLIRRLPAEVLLDALSSITEVPEQFGGYPKGTRALQLPDTAVKSYFLTAFGRPIREQTQESERSSVPTITQALHIINGDTLNTKLRAKGNVLDRLVKAGDSDPQIVKYLYLAAFSRYPTTTELNTLVGHLRAAETQKVKGEQESPRRAALADLTWAMLTSKEFVFEH
ncbi:MAG TPA: DUF1549 domain-containing protein [Terriglobia bacterium]|nr:DUF1549 domain-containing protein [Terriglobia bacterium]